MTSSTRVPATKITGVYGNLLKAMSRKMLGQVPEGAEVMWHHPAVLKDLMGINRKADSWSGWTRTSPRSRSWPRPARSAAAPASTSTTS